MSGSYRVTADGYAGPAQAVRVFNITVKSDGTATSVGMLNGLAGDELDRIQGTVNQSVERNYEAGIVFPLGLYLDCDAHTVYAVVNLEVI